MPNYQVAIQKSKAYALIKNDQKRGRLSHVYLILNEDMDYIKALAKQVASDILGQTNEHSLIKIQKDVHPDVIILGEKEKLTTKSIADLASDVYIRPYEGDYKIYLLLNMQDANDEVQNKLLKTLEEPPSSCYFILGSTQEKKLLQTILSRCKKLDLENIDRQTILDMLEDDRVDRAAREICASCCNGVYSNAFKMATDKEFVKLYQNIFSCLYKMNSSRDILQFSALFNNKNVSKEEFANLFMVIVRDLMMIKSGNEGLINNQHKHDELRLISQGFSMVALEKIIKYCLQLKEDIVYNTNMTAAVDDFLLKVVEVKVKCKE